MTTNHQLLSVEPLLDVASQRPGSKNSHRSSKARLSSAGSAHSAKSNKGLDDDDIKLINAKLGVEGKTLWEMKLLYPERTADLIT